MSPEIREDDDGTVEDGSTSVVLSAVGERIDRALLAALEAQGVRLSRSQLARSFSAGQVVCDGAAVRPGATVREPTLVTVRLPEPTALTAVPQDIPLSVVFEDDDVLVVDKPPRMAVHPGPGHPGGTLVNAVLHHLQVESLPVLSGNPSHRPGLVHRIDKDTSGLLVLARRVEAQEGLARQFREHTIDRRYVALVRGTPQWKSRKVDTTHGRDPTDRRRFAPVVDGTRRATTEFVLAELLTGAARLECRLQTGRTHQIRMHARHLGHPLLGDLLYGRPPKAPDVREVAEVLGRQALHAQVLGFLHPVSGTWMRFESPIPPDMAGAIQRLRSVSA